MDAYISLLKEWQLNQEEVATKTKMLQSKMDEEAIHDVRVAIKKLRAYIRLINEIDGGWDETELIPGTKALFDIVGIHREWETIEQKLEKFSNRSTSVYPLYTAHILEAKKPLVSLIKKQAAFYNSDELKEVQKRIRLVVEAMSSHELSIQCIKAIEKYADDIKRNEKHFDEEVHETRKKLKAIYYWIKLFPPDTLFTVKQVEVVDEFLDKLGKWHDIQVLLAKTKNYRKNYLPKCLIEYRQLKELQFELKDKQQQIFEKLVIANIIHALKDMHVK